MKMSYLGRMILISILTAALATGCGGSAGESKESEDKNAAGNAAEEETFTEEESAEEPAETVGTDEVSAKDDATEDEPAVTGKTDTSFNLYGKKYTMPLSLSDLEADGWSAAGYDMNTTLQGNNHALIYLEKTGGDSIKLSVYVYNPTGNAITLAETSISSIIVKKDEYEKLQFSLENGLTPADNPVTVRQVMGKPDTSSDTDSEMKYIYGVESEDSISFTWPKQKDHQPTIAIRYSPHEQTASSSEVPEYLTAYTAPSVLGDDLDSATFSLDGTIYRLPFPVSELISHGWTVTKDDDLAAGDFDFISLEKDGIELIPMVRNYADYQTFESNCAVFKIDFKAKDDTAVPALLLPKNLSFDTDEATLESTLKESSIDFTRKDSGSIHLYHGAVSDTEITISYEAEKQRIISIEIENSKWPD